MLVAPVSGLMAGGEQSLSARVAVRREDRKNEAAGRAVWGTSFGHQVPLVIKNPAEFLEPAAERLPGLKPG